MRQMLILLGFVMANQSHALEAMSEQAMRTVGESMAAASPSSMLDCQSPTQGVKSVCDVPENVMVTSGLNVARQVDVTAGMTAEMDASPNVLGASQIGTQMQAWIGAVQQQMQNMPSDMGPRR